MLKTTYYGNSFLGLFFRANNSIALAPLDAPEKNVHAIEKALGVSTLALSIGKSTLLGVYTAMNNNGIIVPNIIEKEEVAILKKAGLNVFVSRELNNAYGNNICVNDKGGIVNPHVDRVEKEKIEDVLGVELIQISIAKYTTVGSACIASNKGFLAHYGASEDEIRAIEEALKVKGDKGSINMGIGFVGIGVIMNDNGFVAGEDSTGFEIGKISSALGYI